MAKAKTETEKIIETEMSLRFLKAYVGKLGNFKAGRVYKVDSNFAQDFISNGDAEEASE